MEVSTVTLRKRCDRYTIILQKLGEQVPQFFIDLQEKKKELELESENVIQQTLSLRIKRSEPTKDAILDL